MSTTLKGTELTAEDAFGTLNYYEIQDMKRSFNLDMSQIESLAVEAMYGLVWVIERRNDSSVKPPDIKGVPFVEISNYFADADPDPESDQGKGESDGDLNTVD